MPDDASEGVASEGVVDGEGVAGPSYDANAYGAGKYGITGIAPVGVVVGVASVHPATAKGAASVSTPRMLLIPSSVPPGRLSAICIFGTYTKWDHNTSWNTRSLGKASVRRSTCSVAIQTYAAWAVDIGPGTGQITISDGVCAAVLNVG